MNRKKKIGINYGQHSTPPRGLYRRVQVHSKEIGRQHHRTFFIEEGKAKTLFFNITDGTTNPERIKYRMERLVQLLVKHQGKEHFNLNEFPSPAGKDSQLPPHKLQLDFDGDLDEGSRAAISQSLDEIAVGGCAGCRWELKKAKSRWHLKTNIVFPQYLPTRYGMQYLRDYLSDCVILSKAEFDALFDTAAMGTYTAYSRKFKNGAWEEGYYVPTDCTDTATDPMVEEMAALIWRNSIYNPEGMVEMTYEFANRMHEYAVEAEADAKARKKKIEDVKSELIEGRININGQSYPAGTELLKVLVDCIECKDDQWWWMLKLVKSAAQLAPGYKDHFLHEWSTAGAKYSRVGNEERWRAAECIDAGTALTMLRNKAQSNAELGMKLKALQPAATSRILDRTYKVFFADYLQLLTCVHENLDSTKQFIRDTIAYIVAGGNSYYITKNRKDERLIDYVPFGNLKIKGEIAYKNGKGRTKVMKLA